MAEMNVGMNNVINPVTPKQNASVQTTDPRTQDTNAVEKNRRDEDRRAAVAAEKPEKRTERELENVVSVSEDGDTVQASPKSVEKLTEEASVRKIAGEENDQRDTAVRPEANFRTDDEDDRAEKLAEQKERTEEAARERKEEMLERVEEEQKRRAEVMEKIEDQNEPKAERVPATREQAAEPVRVDVGENSPERKVTSYAGVTDQQLEQMYLKGTISKYDYDTELSSRAERQESAERNSREFNQNSAEMIGAANQTRQNFNAIEDAYDNQDETADEARKATERLDAMSAVQQTMERQ